MAAGMSFSSMFMWKVSSKKPTFAAPTRFEGTADGGAKIVLLQRFFDSSNVDGRGIFNTDLDEIESHFADLFDQPERPVRER